MKYYLVFDNQDQPRLYHNEYIEEKTMPAFFSSQKQNAIPLSLVMSRYWFREIYNKYENRYTPTKNRIFRIISHNELLSK